MAPYYAFADAGMEIGRRRATKLDNGEGCCCGRSAAPEDEAQACGSTEVIVSYEQVKEIALAKIGGGKVKEIELDYERDFLVYEVEVKYKDIKYELEISAQTGRVVRCKPDLTSGAESAEPVKGLAEATLPSSQNESPVKILPEQAEKIALAKVGGGKIKEIELEYDKNRLLYEVEIKYEDREYEVKVDAFSGKIIKCKIGY